MTRGAVVTPASDRIQTAKLEPLRATLERFTAATCQGGPANTKRIVKEWTAFVGEQLPFLAFADCERKGCIGFVKLLMLGQQGTPYAGGVFELLVEYPSAYPMKPPAVRFLTPIYHYAVNSDGKLCLPLLLDKWSPACSIVTILEEISMLIMQPSLYDPQGQFSSRAWLSELLRVSPEEYRRNAEQQTKAQASKTVKQLTTAMASHNPVGFRDVRKVDVSALQCIAGVDDDDESVDGDVVIDSHVHDAINTGKVRGFTGVTLSGDKAKSTTTLTLDVDVSPESFSRVLEFLYTGQATIASKRDGVQPMMKAAKRYQCPELTRIGMNVLSNQEELNPSIGTFLNDQSGQVAKDAFLNKSILADITFELHTNGLAPMLVPAHSSFVQVRSSVMEKLVKENDTKIIIDFKNINATKVEFDAILEFMYTDHCDIEETDPVLLLQAAEMLGLRRIVTLCELFITKVIDRSVINQIEKSEIDVCGILNVAAANNAQQLETFCLHFMYHHPPPSPSPSIRS